MTSIEKMPIQKVLSDNDDDDDNDPLAEFMPLNSTLSYASLAHPPSQETIEVMPTQDIQSMRVSMQHSFIGIPFHDDVNKRNVSKSGKRITRKHSQYALTAGMMLGIRECVGGADGLFEAEFDVGNKPANFTREELINECQRERKYTFPPNVPFEEGFPLPFSYKFKAYAPLIFARIRSAFGVDKQLFLHSICGKFKFIEFMSNAKSGSFFFFSHDGRYMIKTQTVEECKFMQDILPKYYHHLKDNPHSFLTHFYGMYRVKIPETSQKIYFCIMKSIFCTKLEINKIWDLKGSTQGRRAKPGETVKKDLDILEEGKKVYVGENKKLAIMTQLTSDTSFLSGLGIMDYSMLLGEHDGQSEPSLRNLKTSETDESASTKVTSNAQHQRQSYQFGDKRHTSLTESSPPFVRKDDDITSLTESSPPFVVHKDDESISSTGTTITASSQNLESENDILHFCPLNMTNLEDLLSKFTYTIEDNTPKQLPGPNPFTSRDDGGIVSDSQKMVTNSVHFCGIIDILQSYTARKWGETVVKKAAGNEASTISCVDPETYAKRFLKFMSDLME